MSELIETDRILLRQLKERIEQLSGLPGNSDLSQKDIDFLLYYIQDKTGQVLSLTTIKRIWRNEFQRMPHLSTLNMLAQLAWGKEWHTAKKEFLENQKEDRNAVSETTSGVPPSAVSTRRGLKLKGKSILVGSAIGIIVLLVAATTFYVSRFRRPDFSNIKFSASPTTDLRIPNSVVFHYDLANVEGEDFYIQQSWDPAKQIQISPVNKNQTDIYYEPGYHYAKLLIDGTIAKEIPVHIKYNDWYVRFRYPDSKLTKVDDADLNRCEFGLGLKPGYVRQRFKPQHDSFQLGYMLSKEFDLSADVSHIQARVKFDSIYAPLCPMINLLIKGDRDYAWITLGNKGCESNLSLKVGDKYVNGKTNDLSSLGLDAFSWQDIDARINNGTLRLYLNDQLIREESYSNSLGNLKEIDFFFNGIGSIGEVKISGDQNDSNLSRGF
jgi:hypothetical protein